MKETTSISVSNNQIRVIIAVHLFDKAARLSAITFVIGNNHTPQNQCKSVKSVSKKSIKVIL